MEVNMELEVQIEHYENDCGSLNAKNYVTYDVNARLAGAASLVQAVALLRMANSTVERMRVQGTGPRFIKAGPGKRSRVLYRLAEIHAWLEKQSFGSTSEYPR